MKNYFEAPWKEKSSSPVVLRGPAEQRSGEHWERKSNKVLEKQKKRQTVNQQNRWL